MPLWLLWERRKGSACNGSGGSVHKKGIFGGHETEVAVNNVIHIAFVLYFTVYYYIFVTQITLTMGQSTLSIRVDDKLKKSFDELCNEIGLSNSAAVTIFMKAAVREQRIPFELRTETEDEIRARGLAAFHKLRAIAQENGVAGMSLEEINEEIRLARRGE